MSMSKNIETAVDSGDLGTKIAELKGRRRKMIRVIAAVNVLLLVLVLVQFVITEVDEIKEYNQSYNALKSHSQQMHDLSLDALNMLDKVGENGADYDEYKTLNENVKQSDSLHEKVKHILDRSRFSSNIVLELRKYDEQVNNCLQRMHNNLGVFSRRSDLLEYHALRDKLDEMMINSTRIYNNSKWTADENLRQKLLEANKEAGDLLNSNLSDDDIVNSKASLMQQLQSSISKIKELADEIQEEGEKTKKSVQPKYHLQPR